MDNLNSRLYKSYGDDLAQQMVSDDTVFGQDVLRSRPAYTDKAGVNHPLQVDTYRVLLGQQREFYVHMSNPTDGYNIDNDGLKHLLFPLDADVVEDDELIFNGYVWTVSRAADPFVVNNVQTYWSVQCIRARMV